MRIPRHALPLSVTLALHAAPLLAQQLPPIERIKVTDNEMNCAQMHAETVAMDKAIADAKAVADSGSRTAVAGQAGNVAAEVAGRTGLFGSLGGVAGALFGQAAAQTAAGVAAQSGQQTAQQAAERSRQALARKEHVTALFLGRGCKASDLSYDPPAGAVPAAAPAPAGAPAGTPPAAPEQAPRSEVPAPVAALPDVDPDAHFRGKMGGTFGKNLTEVLPASKRVAVAGFRVVFITDNTASATVRASYLPGRDTSGASSSLHVALSGVDHATMQALTDRAHADLLAQLKLAGREVVPQDQLKDFLAGVDATATAPGKPYMKENGAQAGVAFAPSGMPLWFSHADAGWTDRGLFDQKNYRLMAEHAQKWNAITIAPLLVVNYAQMSSSGNRSGLTARAAETGAALAMRVEGFSSAYLRSDEFRNGIIMKGDEGGISMAQAVASPMSFGSLREVSATDNKAVVSAFNALGNAMGLANAGGANRSKSENVAETSNAAYAAAAGDALRRATGTFAKLFQKYPAP